jgi:hypothetical protein
MTPQPILGGQHMINIDQYSLAALPIEMYFNSKPLSTGTAFVWKSEGRLHLITNWHNVSGKDPNTGRHLSSTAAEPNNLKIWFNQKGAMGYKVAKAIPTRGQNGAPLWLVHPQHENKVDVVALPFDPMPDVEEYAINDMASENLLVSVGMDVFVLGYPFGMGPAGFPVWKRGSLASEPGLSSIAQLQILVDTASRPGMSGSPVIRRSWGTHMLENGNVSVSTGSGTATRFIGIYSGRIVSADPIDAQIGITWPACFIPEIVSGQKIDS